MAWRRINARNAAEDLARGYSLETKLGVGEDWLLKVRTPEIISNKLTVWNATTFIT